MTSSRARLAVLIDADNTSPKYADALLDELAKYGVATVKRAYGDWTTTQLGGWKAQLNRHAIAPVQQFAYTTGKNSTDSALIIDAMDLLYSGNLDGFALVSSDSDFTRLATRIRESGMTVYGLGLRKTPSSLVAACDKFVYLEVLGDEPEDQDEAEPLPDLEPLMRRAVDSTSQDDGWAHLGAIGNFLSSASTSFDPRNYGFSKLIALAQAQPYLEVDSTAGTPRARLRTATPRRRRSTAARKATADGTAPKKSAAKSAATSVAKKSAANQTAAKQASSKAS